MKKRPDFLPIFLFLSILLLVSCNLFNNVQPKDSVTPPFIPTAQPQTTPLPAETLQQPANPQGQMDPTLPPGISEAYIEGVLQHSTKIVDASQDWILHKPEIDNPVLYPVDFGDINNMKIGLDDQYLYIKLTMNGTIPGAGLSFPMFDGDQLMSFGNNLGFDTDNNPHTGCIADGGTEIMTGYGIKYENGTIHTNWLSYMTDPTGTETPEDARYRNRIFGQQSRYGGEGQSYFIMTFLLPPLNFARGQEITIDTWVEVSSQRYDHASFDTLCPQSQVDPTHLLFCPIKIKLGEEATIR